jgi:putative spermidine/putrescine transport system substrate-binding protein
MPDTRTTSRRALLRGVLTGAGTLAVPGLLTACGTPTAATSSTLNSGPYKGVKSKEVVYADFGGTTREARTKAFFDPFTKATGIQVVNTLTADSIQAQMDSGKAGPYDAIPASQYELYAAMPSDSATKLASDVTLDDELESQAQSYGWGTFITAYAQGYLAKTFPGGGPTTWADFWDVKKFPGKRAWPGTAYSYDCTIEAALLADGVSPDKLYPLDFARGFAKLNELRPHMVFFTEFPQVQQFLISGTASIGFAPHGLFVGLDIRGIDTTVVMNQALQVPNLSFTSPHSPHKDAAFALAEWMTDGTRQAAFAALTGYGPGNKAALSHFPAKVLKMIPNSSENEKITIRLNNTVLNDQYNDYLSGYTKWLAK